MKTRIQTLHTTNENAIRQFLGKDGNILFFDIETTGLSPKNASVYLIGAAVIEDKKWTLHQWFAENTAEEEAILDAFLQFSVPYKKLVHFNGTTFDIPFLQAKCKKYGLTASFAEMEQTDIYRQISPFKNLLKLSNCKQKSLEEFLGLNREDPFNGGQLIELYKVYRQERDHRLLEVLLLHNADDLRGMLSVVSILSYPALFAMHPENARAELDIGTDYEGNRQKELLLYLQLPVFLPVPLALHAGGCFFSAKEDSGVLKIPVYSGELKFYYPDYKNYSYLPEEDKAIHKSVAVYVDKAHRVPATPATCYTKKEGDFLPQHLLPSQDDLFTPAFRREARQRAPRSAGRPYAQEKESFFLLEEAFLNDSGRLSLYAHHILNGMR